MKERNSSIELLRIMAAMAVVVYLFSPYINIILNSLSIKELRFLLTLSVMVFSFWAFPIDVFFRDFNIDLNTGSPVGIGGGHGGCSFVNLCLAYLIGAYVQRSDMRLCWQKALTGFVICTVLLLIWRYFELHIGIECIRLTARTYHNPLVLAQAALALLIAKDITFKCKTVNILAGAAFTCYMVQGFILPKIGVEIVIHKPLFMLFFHMFISLIGIYLASFILYFAYKYTLNRLFNSLNRIEISYGSSHQ